MPGFPGTLFCFFWGGLRSRRGYEADPPGRWSGSRWIGTDGALERGIRERVVGSNLGNPNSATDDFNAAGDPPRSLGGYGEDISKIGDGVSVEGCGRGEETGEEMGDGRWQIGGGMMLDAGCGVPILPFSFELLPSFPVLLSCFPNSIPSSRLRVSALPAALQNCADRASGLFDRRDQRGRVKTS